MNRLSLVWIISVISFFSALTANADGVARTDFVFQLDNSIFTSPEFDFYSRLEGEEKFDIPDTIFEDEAPVHVRGIDAKIRYKLATGQKQVHLGVETMFVSTQLSGQMRIREVEVDAVVERVIGGVKVRANVKAMCRNIPIELKNGGARVIGGIHALVDQDGLPSLRVPWMGLEWGENSWSIGEFECAGAAGFKDQVATNLRKYLSDSSRFERDIKVRVDAQVHAYQERIQKWFLEGRVVDSGIQGLSLVLRPRKIARLEGDRFQIHGQLEFRFSNSAVSTLHVVSESAPVGGMTLHSLALPESAVFALNQAAFEAGFYDFRKRGSEIPGFQDLRSSTLKSSFAWPELSRVQKAGEFLFDFNAPEKPRLSKFVASGNGSLLVRTESALSVLTSAPSGSTHTAFANFRTPINGSMSLSVVSGTNGKSALKVLFSSDLKLKLEAAWDPRYTPQKTHIGVGTFEEKIVKSLASDGFDFEFGQITLTQKLRLRASSLGKIGPNWLELRLLPANSPP